MSSTSRARGVLYGQFIGDSLGSRYEFMKSQSVKDKIASDSASSPSGLVPILGGGPFGFRKGEVTDDGEMALSLSASLMAKGGYEKEYVACAYVRWTKTNPRDIGVATQQALAYDAIPKDWMTTMDKSEMKKVHKQVHSNVSKYNENSLSNGSLMRISPLPVYYREKKLKDWIHFAIEDASLTHCAPPVLDAVSVYCRAIHNLINGMDRVEAHNTLSMSSTSRARGVLYGQFIGDSLGSRYEFMKSQSVKDKIASDSASSPSGLVPILGGGPFGFRKGEVTDDGEMALSLSASLMAKGGYEKEYVACAYVRWTKTNPRDIGVATQQALAYDAIPKDWMTTMDKSEMKKVHKQVHSNVSKYNENSLSNGSLMRISPLPVYYREKKLKDWIHFAIEDASLTHCAPPVLDAVSVYCRAIHNLINGMDRVEAHKDALAHAKNAIVKKHLELSRTQLLPVPYGDNFSKQSNGDDCAIGYMGVALQLAFYQLLHSTDFTSGLIDVIKIGGDTDTNGCITGALLGAFYGDEHIPKEWMDTVNTTPSRIVGENGVTTVAEMIDKMTN